VTTLDKLQPGQTARVVDVVGDDALTARILEMGITDGEQIKMIGRAPLGDPLEYSVRGYRLSLRQAEARRVAVTLD
jgi:ferrous iron transport protein A